MTKLVKKRYTVEEKRWLLTQAPAKHDPLPIADYLGMLGVSEASFHRWQAHPDELKNASSRPKQSPQALPVDEVAQVLVAALKHPDWGGEKISDYLAINGITYVSPATASRIKKRLKAALGGRMPKFSQRYEFIKPNDAWATDIFQFTWESHKLYLIIVQDDHSRLILNWTITANTSSAIVQQLLIQTFGRYGLPVLLKTDNGPEFRKQLREFLESYRSHHYPSPPYRPSFNGKVERKYRDMRELIKDIPTDATLETVIGCIAEHIYEHNHVRPHQSLGGTTPFQRYHGFAEQVKAQVEQIKAEVDRRRREPATKLIIPGQPERPTRPQALIVPNKKKDGDSKGLIVPLRSADNRRKRVGFVRLFIAS